MRRLLPLSLLLALGACGHTTQVIAADPSTQPVCDKVVPPPVQPLANFMFFPVPPGTTAPGGVTIVAGLTADGMADILGNHQKLKTREEKWQERAKAVNKCLDQEVKDRTNGR